MTAVMPETVFITDNQREYLLSWNANWQPNLGSVKSSVQYCFALIRLYK